MVRFEGGESLPVEFRAQTFEDGIEQWIDDVQVRTEAKQSIDDFVFRVKGGVIVLGEIIDRAVEFDEEDGCGLRVREGVARGISSGGRFQ